MSQAKIVLSWTIGLIVVVQGFVHPFSHQLVGPSSSSNNNNDKIFTSLAMTATATSSAATSIPSSWADLQTRVGETPVGKALNKEASRRSKGFGSAHVHNTLRYFNSINEDDGDNANDKNDLPPITLYRDFAGWCPYCQKLMLLVEEKKVPVQLSLVPMRSYGDKPTSFTRKVPGGLLPAMEVNGKIITESSVIMELLDRWHTPEDGYLPMMPSDEAGRKRYEQLFNLERELFSWWCTLIFRPEMPALAGGGRGGGNLLSSLLGGGGEGGSSSMSGNMQGFLDCIQKVDSALKETKGPWFFDEHDYPTMIDFIFVSHVERMLASCAYWKGLDLRDAKKWNLHGLNAWLEAFEKREPYLAFKSDYYTHVKDIPPQYGPGYDGGFEADRLESSNSILGKDGSWTLPLSHDDKLQPLYRGPPLPISVLEAAGIHPDPDGAYEKSSSADPKSMARACRLMAAWKLAGNGSDISKFSARGGPDGSKNPRKTFQAELADPYAEPDVSIVDAVDAALRVVCLAMSATEQEEKPDDSFRKMLFEAVPTSQASGVASSLAYLRDRVGVPRDLPLAAARYLRAYLNWGIDVLDG